MRDVLQSFAQVRPAGDGWTARCPAHEDARSSLSLGRGAEGRWLLNCHAGCTFEDIVAAAGLKPSDLFLERPAAGTLTIKATYDYRDEGGLLLYQVVRLDPKDFRQRRPVGQSSWAWNLGTVRRVAYRLPELQGQPAVYIVEGEKDVEALRGLGLTATTNAGGAGKWRPDYTQQLKAAAVERVIVLPDNDDPGRAHARDVAASCCAAGLKVQIVDLSGLPAKGDVSDWLNAGHTLAELLALVTAAPPWAPGTPGVTEPPLTLTPLADLLNEPDDAVEWVVDDRIACGSINLLAGKPKAGKSTLARALALAMSTGTPFLGWRTTAGTVWYLVLEDKRSEVKRHFRSMGATGREAVRFLFGQRDALLDKVAQLAEQERPTAIIVDTLQRLIGAKDLNDYAEVTDKLTPLILLARATSAALVLVHHAGKSDRAGIDSVLGSTALAGSVDNLFLVNRTERYRLLSSIQRIGPDLPDTVIALDDCGRPLATTSRHDADVAHLETALLDTLTAAGTLTRADWLTACEGKHQVKVEALNRLNASGTIIRTGKGTKGDPHRYMLATAAPVPSSLVPSNSREPESSSSLFGSNSNLSDSDSSSRVPVVPEVPADGRF